MNPLLLLLLLLLLSSLNPSSSASNSISSNQTLYSTQKLISDGGNFALGFFKPGKPNYYYIGIWYNKISKQTPVWVASRDTPITDPTTTHLKISAGNLVLSNRSNPNIWSTNILANTSTTTTVAVLLDTGNLVIKDVSNPNTTLWQSFDHPTDTWLPGGKLGLNKVTGVRQHLTSWKSTEDPSSGLYHDELDPTIQYYYIWNNSKQYWTSGTWNGQFFSQVPEMVPRQNDNFCFWYVNDTTESYFTYTVKSNSIITRHIMDVSGQMQTQTWLPDSQGWNIIWSRPLQECDVYSLCGPYGSCNQNVQPYCKCLRGFSEKSPTNWDLGDRSGGCVRNTPLQCSRNSSVEGSVGKDKFYAMSNTRLPDHPQTLVQVGSASDCEQACLNNCSCTAYSYGSSSGCSVWHDDLLNLQEQVSSSRGTLFLRLAASEIIDMPKSNKGTVIRAVTAGGVASCLILLVVVWVLIWRRRRSGMAGKSKAVVGGLLAFRYSDLQCATNNFSEKLGGGAFGSVFKGILPNSTAVAVKKLEGFRQGDKQFRTEVSTIGTVQHVNLVRLHGFCSQGKEKLLVYEYMPNGSLDTHLFQYNSGATAVPDWKTRYQIALGTARGLTYLHEQCRDCIIHCDIKPENILLDAHLVPKVADFGLAKLVGRDFSRVLTTMRGTIGYLAPEWISGVAITAKADVYSYGMMLFEITSGKRNLDQGEESKIGFFPILAATKLMEGDAMMSLLDQRLKGDANAEEVTRACKVACWCIQDNEDSRPSMGQVVQMLEGLVEVSMPPMPRALQLLTDYNPENIVFYSELTSNSSQTHRDAILVKQDGK